MAMNSPVIANVGWLIDLIKLYPVIVCSVDRCIFTILKIASSMLFQQKLSLDKQCEIYKEFDFCSFYSGKECESWLLQPEEGKDNGTIEEGWSGQEDEGDWDDVEERQDGLRTLGRRFPLLGTLLISVLSKYIGIVLFRFEDAAVHLPHHYV